ncbi:MAG: arginine N-succinyltransferase [Legionellales bacterium]|nr:MAG: arginine N-succinyltransferase [Legionellales bacterium]
MGYFKYDRDDVYNDPYSPVYAYLLNMPYFGAPRENMTKYDPTTVIRPVRETDFKDLYELAKNSGIGFTSLPINVSYLKKRIEISIKSFQKQVTNPNGENYLFVLEDIATGTLVGTSGVVACVGETESFYSYKVGKITKACAALNIRKIHETLSLTTDYVGSSELCTLFVLPKYRKHANGQLLARSRFLFMHEFRKRFCNLVIAELRGVSDKNGFSPFWSAIGKNFFGFDFPQADYLTGLGEKQFISDLMPEFRLYISMLPKSAQDVIGQVHKDTVPAFKLLERENFVYKGYVDIFDAGPTIEAFIDKISSIKQCRYATISGFANNAKTKTHIISNLNIDFRACVGSLEFVKEQEVTLPETCAKALQLNIGDKLKYITLH